MNWHTLSRLDSKTPQLHQAIIKKLLINRGLTTKQDIDTFLHPPHPNDISATKVGLNSSSLKKAVSRVKQAVGKHELIIVYGDYDADGICATAILWESLNSIGAKALPFIPQRETHGYGLSISGLKEIIAKHHPSLIITVDNGIVATQAAAFLAKQKIDLIITDHHQKSSVLPLAYAHIHTDTISGSAVSWYLAQAIHPITNHLELAAIGTIADLMPMVGINRSFAKYGLDALATTNRPGLLALKTDSGIKDTDKLSTYHVGFMIAPRLNAMGRIKHGLDALRLLCTSTPSRAKALAALLSDTNRARQDLTLDQLEQAEHIYQNTTSRKHNIIIIDHEDFHEGIIGLIAGKLTETYHKPSIVISKSESLSKASARSISGVNIIELIRTHADLLEGAGGHPGAAGFTIMSDRIEEFRQALTTTANQTIDPSLLTRSLTVDLALDFTDITRDLYDDIQQFEPFGIGNKRPVFSMQARLADFRTVGRDHSHLKLTLQSKTDKPTTTLDAIGFKLGKHASSLSPNQTLQLAFTLDLNTFGGRTSLQLLLKDIKP